ncbi:hypothetical protein V3C33_14730 [Micrococcaceae bacterium Sec5.7]
MVPTQTAITTLSDMSPMGARFADVGAEVLRGLLGRTALDRDLDGAVEHVMGGMAALGLHPDVADGVRTLKSAGYRLVTLTNGSPQVAEKLFAHHGPRRPGPGVGSGRAGVVHVRQRPQGRQPGLRAPGGRCVPRRNRGAHPGSLGGGLGGCGEVEFRAGVVVEVVGEQVRGDVGEGLGEVLVAPSGVEGRPPDGVGDVACRRGC